MILSILFLVVGILLLCWTGILDVMGYDIKKVHNLAFVGIFVTLIGLISVGFSTEIKPPEKQHEKLLQNIEEANKELQKFYIEHPEFKEN